MKIPELKKDIHDFLLSEEGRITKGSLIKLGVLSAGAILATQPAEADVCTATCLDTLETGEDVSLVLTADTTGSLQGMDMMSIDPSCPDLVKEMKNDPEAYSLIEGGDVSRSMDFSSWLNNGKNTANSEASHTYKFQETFHSHANSLTLQSGVETLTAFHSHSIDPHCENARIEVGITCSVGDRQLVGTCETYDSDGSVHDNLRVEKNA